jgi:SpoVK/Ycf46/Vps4 family AAA+-type ATPase
MAFQNLYTLAELAADFGPVIAFEGPIARTQKDMVGPFYRSALAETTEIIAHQWANGVRRSAVKGFFLGGPPGVGKTMLVRRVAYELCRRFQDPTSPDGESPVVLALIDGGEIARARYGESESRIREVFSRAQKGFSAPSQRSVILFDDVESVLMARGSENAKEWHFSQDSVFFHSVDELDTSRTAVFLTSNRPDLVDEAILDRFLAYSFGVPNRELLVEIAVRNAAEQRFDAEQIAHLAERIRRAADEGKLVSIREAERMVVREYVENVLGRPSAALIGADRWSHHWGAGPKAPQPEEPVRAG